MLNTATKNICNSHTSYIDVIHSSLQFFKLALACNNRYHMELSIRLAWSFCNRDSFFYRNSRFCYIARSTFCHYLRSHNKSSVRRINTVFKLIKTYNFFFSACPQSVYFLNQAERDKHTYCCPK